MKRYHLALFAAVSTIALSGCALCPPGYLDDYAAIGGKWERTNPTSGRVGSTLSDAGASGEIIGSPDGIYDDSSIMEGEYIESEYIEGGFEGYQSPSDVIMLGDDY